MSEEISFEVVQDLIVVWARERKIIPNATPVSQLLKAVSEMGELCDAEGKKDTDAIVDAVGDVMVCLINYCELRGIDITLCLYEAYNQIKDRKGTLMPDGTFVKESD